MRNVTRVSLILGLGAVSALAQSVISARSGMVHYVEGTVYIGDQQVERKFGNFPEIKENAVLRTTAEGRAEVLLTPGVFLRVGESSSFRMITNRLADTRLELEAGSAVIEATELPPDNSVTVVYQDYAVHLEKAGLYRLDSQPAALRVFSGKATLSSGDSSIEVTEGRMAGLEKPLTAARFDKEGFDALDRWSRSRDAVVSMANVASARVARTQGLLRGGSGWAYNPYFGMYTYLPFSGSGAISPYGCRFWSPMGVMDAYWSDYCYGGAWQNMGGFYSYIRPQYAGGLNTGGNTGGGTVARPSSPPMSRMPSRTRDSGIESGGFSNRMPTYTSHGGGSGGGGGGISASAPSGGMPSGGIRSAGGDGGGGGTMGGRSRH